jgi:carboxypeptidase T
MRSRPLPGRGAAILSVVAIAGMLGTSILALRARPAPAGTPGATLGGAALDTGGIQAGARSPGTESNSSPAATEPPASTAPTTSPPPAAALPTCPAEDERFPTGYAAFHTYAELCRAVVAAATAHPDIARLSVIGKSYEGRDIFAMEISAHVGDATRPPGVLFDGLTHGLEHLSLEMPIAIMGWLLDGYGHDPTITRLVRTRAIFIVFDVNPDGAAYDIAGGRFHDWRKNRQPGPGGVIGTDLNRNYDDHWGCCGLVSAKPGSAYYRGTSPFSAPETQALRDYIEGLAVDGHQQIRAAITFHDSGRLILWPYGYTTRAIPSDMTAEDHAVFAALGTAMAHLDGYTAEQASRLYVDSGTERDWDYGTQGIFAFTVELGTGTYQRSAAVAAELARNKAAVLFLIDAAACPYALVDKASRCV